jgi:hypothetical protein
VGPSRQLRKVVDETNVLDCKCGVEMVIREEVFQDFFDRTVKYNLAFIHFPLCRKDNGRVLGYDNAHGFHERHYMGEAEKTEFVSYEDTLEQFLDEVQALRRNHEKEYRRRKLG